MIESPTARARSDQRGDGRLRCEESFDEIHGANDPRGCSGAPTRHPQLQRPIDPRPHDIRPGQLLPRPHSGGPRGTRRPGDGAPIGAIVVDARRRPLGGGSRAGFVARARRCGRPGPRIERRSGALEPTALSVRGTRARRVGRASPRRSSVSPTPGLPVCWIRAAP
jgi:hypothetical protein